MSGTRLALMVSLSDSDKQVSFPSPSSFVQKSRTIHQKTNKKCDTITIKYYTIKYETIILIDCTIVRVS